MRELFCEVRYYQGDMKDDIVRSEPQRMFETVRHKPNSYLPPRGSFLRAFRSSPAFFLLCLALTVFWAATAHGQPQPAEEPLTDALRGILQAPAPAPAEAASLNDLGKRLASEIPPGVETERQSTQRYPIAPTAAVAIYNEFGPVRITAWEERVVEVQVRIRARAETDAAAQALAEAVQVSVAHAEDRVELRTVLPKRAESPEYVSMQVEYQVMAPKEASVRVRNFFGDTFIRGFQGEVTVDAQYGAVDLDGLAAPAHVSSHGEFPVKVRELSQGGVFDLYGAPAEFMRVGGILQIHSFRGDVVVRTPAPAIQLDATVDSAALRVRLPVQTAPDLTATVLYGEFESAWPVDQRVQADKRIAEHRAPESSQKMNLRSTFGSIHIEREDAPASSVPPADGETKPFTESETRTEALGNELRMIVQAAPGDLHIEGTEGNSIEIAVTRTVKAVSASDAPAALEALHLDVSRAEGAIRIVSTNANPPGPSNAAARISLDIKCPRQLGIETQAADGKTEVIGFAGPVILRQAAGAVSAERIKSGLSVINQNGGVIVSDCGGAEAAVNRGDAVLKRVAGPIRAEAIDGHIVVESPQGPLILRNNGGDIRILALEGVLGAWDVRVEKGNLRALLAPESDVSLSLQAVRGAIHSTIPLQGVLSPGKQEFNGRMKDGLFPVRFETADGDITLD